MYTFLFQCANIQAFPGQTTEAKRIFYVYPLYLHNWFVGSLQLCKFGMCVPRKKGIRGKRISVHIHINILTRVITICKL